MIWALSLKDSSIARKLVFLVVNGLDITMII